MSEEKRVTVILDEEVDRRVEIFCAVMGVTKDSVIRNAIKAYLKANADELQKTVKAIAESF